MSGNKTLPDTNKTRIGHKVTTGKILISLPVPHSSAHCHQQCLLLFFCDKQDRDRTPEKRAKKEAIKKRRPPSLFALTLSVLIAVENTGVEPVTSFPNAFGTASALAFGQDQPFNIFSALLAFYLPFTFCSLRPIFKRLRIFQHPIIRLGSECRNATIMLAKTHINVFGVADIVFVKNWRINYVDVKHTKCKNRPFGRFKAVENTGVEPVTSCMPCKRSSQMS